MKAMDLMDVKYVVKCNLAKAIYDAKFSVGKAWVDGKISEQQQEMIDRELSNALTLATVAINNCESQQEIDEVVAELEKHMQRYISRNNLPFIF